MSFFDDVFSNEEEDKDTLALENLINAPKPELTTPSTTGKSFFGSEPSSTPTPTPKSSWSDELLPIETPKPSTTAPSYGPSAAIEEARRKGLWGDEYGAPVGDGSLRVGGGITAPTPSYITGVRQGSTSYAPSLTSTSSTSTPAREKVSQIGTYARTYGLDDEGAKVLQSIATIEAGLDGAVGDNGNSFGIYQFHMRGELPAFAAWAGVDIEQAKKLANDPKIATKFAVETYLGNALKQGRAAGLKGADLATYVQTHGQRSQTPEKAGAAYQEWFGDGRDPFVAKAPDIGAHDAAVAGVPTPSPQRSTLRGITPSQAAYAEKDPGDGWAMCGPIAAVGVASAFGITVDMGTAKSTASSVGWTSANGMAGPQSQVALLKKLGLDASYNTLNWDAVKNEVQAGKPVILNAMTTGGKIGHYFVVEDYDPSTGKFYLGNSLLSLNKTIHGGNAWVTPAELNAMQSKTQLNMNPDGMITVKGTPTGGRSVPATTSAPSSAPSVPTQTVTTSAARPGIVPDSPIQNNLGRPVTLWDIANGQWSGPVKPSAPPPQVKYETAPSTASGIPAWQQEAAARARQAPAQAAAAPDKDLQAEFDAAKKYSESVNVFAGKLQTVGQGNVSRTQRGIDEFQAEFAGSRAPQGGDGGDAGFIPTPANYDAEYFPSALDEYPEPERPPATPKLDLIIAAENKKRNDAWVAAGSKPADKPQKILTPVEQYQTLLNARQQIRDQEQEFVNRYKTATEEQKQQIKAEAERRIGVARAAAYAPPTEYTSFLEANAPAPGDASVTVEIPSRPNVQPATTTVTGFGADEELPPSVLPATTKVFSRKDEIDALPEISMNPTPEEIKAAGFEPGVYYSVGDPQYEANIKWQNDRLNNARAQGYFTSQQKDAMKRELAIKGAVTTAELTEREAILRNAPGRVSPEKIAEIRAQNPTATENELAELVGQQAIANAPNQYGNLTGAERQWEIWSTGWQQVRSGTGAGIAAFGNLLNNESITEYGSKLWQEAEMANRNRQVDPKSLSLPEKVLQAAPSVAISIAVGLPIGIGLSLVGAPAGAVLAATVGAGAATTFIQEGGGAYAEARKEGASDGQATAAFLLTGGINAAIESAPIGAAVSKIPGAELAMRRLTSIFSNKATNAVATALSKSAAGRALIDAGENITAPLVKNFLAEGGQEALQEAVGTVTATIYNDKDFLAVVKELQEKVPEAFLVGGLLGTGTEAVGLAANRIPESGNKTWAGIYAALFQERSGTQPDSPRVSPRPKFFDDEDSGPPVAGVPAGNIPGLPGLDATAPPATPARGLEGLERPLVTNTTDTDGDYTYNPDNLDNEKVPNFWNELDAFAKPPANILEYDTPTRMQAAVSALAVMEEKTGGLNADQRAAILSEYGITDIDGRHMASAAGYHVSRNPGDKAAALEAIKFVHDMDPDVAPSLEAFRKEFESRQSQVQVKAATPANAPQAPTTGPSAPQAAAPAPVAAPAPATAPTVATPSAAVATPAAQPGPVASIPSSQTAAAPRAPETAPTAAPPAPVVRPEIKKRFRPAPKAQPAFAMGGTTNHEFGRGRVYSMSQNPRGENPTYIPSGENIFDGEETIGTRATPETFLGGVQAIILEEGTAADLAMFKTILRDSTTGRPRTIKDVVAAVTALGGNDSDLATRILAKTGASGITYNNAQGQKEMLVFEHAADKVQSGADVRPMATRPVPRGLRRVYAQVPDGTAVDNAAGLDIANGQARVPVYEDPSEVTGLTPDLNKMVPMLVREGDVKTGPDGKLFIESRNGKYVPRIVGDQAAAGAVRPERAPEVSNAIDTMQTLDRVAPVAVPGTNVKQEFQKDELGEADRKAIAESEYNQALAPKIESLLGTIMERLKILSPNIGEVDFVGFSWLPNMYGITAFAPVEGVPSRIRLNLHLMYSGALRWADSQGVDPNSDQFRRFYAGQIVGVLVHEAAHVEDSTNIDETGHGGSHTELMEAFYAQSDVESLVAEIYTTLNPRMLSAIEADLATLKTGEKADAAPVSRTETDTETEARAPDGAVTPAEIDEVALDFAAYGLSDAEIDSIFEPLQTRIENGEVVTEDELDAAIDQAEAVLAEQNTPQTTAQTATAPETVATPEPINILNALDELSPDEAVKTIRRGIRAAFGTNSEDNTDFNDILKEIRAEKKRSKTDPALTLEDVQEALVTLADNDPAYVNKVLQEAGLAPAEQTTPPIDATVAPEEAVKAEELPPVLAPVVAEAAPVEEVAPEEALPPRMTVPTAPVAEAPADITELDETLEEPKKTPGRVKPIARETANGMKLLDADAPLGVGSRAGFWYQSLVNAVGSHTRELNLKAPWTQISQNERGERQEKATAAMEALKDGYDRAKRQRGVRAGNMRDAFVALEALETDYPGIANSIAQRMRLNGYTYTDSDGNLQEVIFPHAQQGEANAQSEQSRTTGDGIGINRGRYAPGARGGRRANEQLSGRQRAQLKRALRNSPGTASNPANFPGTPATNGYYPGQLVHRDADGNVSTKPANRKPLTEIRRNPQPGQPNFVVKEFWSPSQNKWIKADSQGELALMGILESSMHDPILPHGKVVEWKKDYDFSGRRMGFQFFDGGRAATYEPDFIVAYEDGHVEVIEIKSTTALQQEEDSFNTAAQIANNKPRRGWHMMKKIPAAIAGLHTVHPGVQTGFRIIASDDAQLTGKNPQPKQQEFINFYNEVNAIAEMVPYSGEFTEIADPLERAAAVHAVARQYTINAMEKHFPLPTGTTRNAPTMLFVPASDIRGSIEVQNILDNNATQHGLVNARVREGDNPLTGEATTVVSVRGDVVAATKQAAELAKATDTWQNPGTYMFYEDARGQNYVQTFELRDVDDGVLSALTNLQDKNGVTVTTVPQLNGSVFVAVSSRTPNGEFITEAEFTAIRDDMLDALTQMGTPPVNAQIMRGKIVHFADPALGGIDNVIRTNEQQLGQIPTGGSATAERAIPEFGGWRGFPQPANYNAEGSPNTNDTTTQEEVDIPTLDPEIMRARMARPPKAPKAPKAVKVPKPKPAPLVGFDDSKFSKEAQKPLRDAARAITTAGGPARNVRDVAAKELGMDRAEFNRSHANGLSDLEIASILSVLAAEKMKIAAMSGRLTGGRVTPTKFEMRDFLQAGIRFQAMHRQLTGAPTAIRAASKLYTQANQQTAKGESVDAHIDRILAYAKTSPGKSKDFGKKLIDGFSGITMLGATSAQLSQAWHELLNPETTIGDWMLGIVYSALLGPGTVGVSFVGNTAEIAWRGMRDITMTIPQEVAVAMKRDGRTGLTKGLKNGGKVLTLEGKGFLMGSMKAFVAFTEVIVHGATSTQTSMQDLPHTNLQNNNLGIFSTPANIAGWAMEAFWGRFLMAADAFAKTWSYSMQLGREAAIHARNVSRTGEVNMADADAFFHAPTKEMMDKAQRVALETAFQGEMGRGGETLANIQNLPFIGRILFPFLRTIYHTASRAVDRTPIGAFMAIINAVQEAPGKYFTQKIPNIAKSPYIMGTSKNAHPSRPFAERLMDSVIGTTMFMFIGQKIAEGVIELTGQPPDDEKERDMWVNQGKIAHGIKIGNMPMFSYANLGPVTLGLAFIASYNDAKNMKDDVSSFDRVFTGISNFSASAIETSYLSTMAGIMKAASTDVKDGKVMGSDVQREVFGLVDTRIPFGATFAAIGNYQDPYMREANSKDPKKNLSERISARMPMHVPFSETIFGREIGRSTMRPSLDIWGYPRMNPKYQKMNIFDPVRTGIDKNDPVDNEIEALFAQGHDARPSRAPTSYVDPETGVKHEFKDDNEMHEWKRRVGQDSYARVAHLMALPEYQALSPAAKAKEIEAEYLEAREIAFKSMGIRDEVPAQDRRPKYFGLEQDAARRGISVWELEKKAESAIRKDNEFRDAVKTGTKRPELTPEERELANRYRNAADPRVTREAKAERTKSKRIGEDYPGIPFTAIP